eukprot:SAG11_NODE_3886_length_2166_cov_2.698113_1_plen_177_part_00
MDGTLTIYLLQRAVLAAVAVMAALPNYRQIAATHSTILTDAAALRRRRRRRRRPGISFEETRTRIFACAAAAGDWLSTVVESLAVQNEYRFFLQRHAGVTSRWLASRLFCRSPLDTRHTAPRLLEHAIHPRLRSSLAHTHRAVHAKALREDCVAVALVRAVPRILRRRRHALDLRA